MRKIDINLAKRKETTGTIAYVVLAAFVLVALLWSWRTLSVYGHNAVVASSYKERLARAAKGSPAAASRSNEIAPGAEDLKRIKKEAELVNTIIVRETYSWTRLLTGLEKSASGNVVVTQISPDFDERTVTVSGIARSIDDVLAMIDRMGDSGIFKNVFLLKHGESKDKKNTQDPDVILFTLSASYSAEDAL